MSILKRILVVLLSLCMAVSPVYVASAGTVEAAEGAHTHKYDKSTVKEASCKEPGIDKYECECGDSYYSIVTVPHDYDTNGDGKEDINDEGTSITKQPTCTDKGQITYTCKVCGAKKVDELPANGHTPGTPELIPHTCTENGKAVIKCTVCHAVLETTDLGDADKAPGTDHVPGPVQKENEKAVTCKKDGSYDNVIYCTVCKAEISRETVTVKSTGQEHVYSEEDLQVVKPASCTENGISSYTCKECKEVGYVVINASHSWKLKEKAEDDYKERVEATCGKDGKGTYQCEVCGETKVDVIPATGQHTIVEEYKDPTCTEAQMYEKKCSVCGKVLESKPVEGSKPNGHKEASRYVAPTCTKNGQNETYCTVCNKVLKTEDLGELDPSKGGHKLGDWTADKTDKKWKDVTCKENGLKVEVQICSVCKEKVNRRETVVESTGTEHKYPAVGKGTVVTPASCEKNGIERVTCEICKASTYRVVPASHNWVDKGWVAGKEATCAKDGEKNFECAVCKKTKTEKVSKSTVKHTPGQEEYQEPTCTERGKMVVKCTVCKAVISSKDVTGKEADPKGHKEAVRFVEATCEKNGQSETYCTVCNKVLKTEDLGELAPSKGGHKLGDWTADKTDKKWKDVTCKENGLKVEVQICSVCKEKVNRRETVVESTGTEHKYPAVGKGTEVTPATCDKNGIERVTCEICKASTYRVVPASHNWVDKGWVAGKEATCAKDGEKNFECAVCKKTKTEKVSKSTVKHTPGQEEYQEPTCTERGKMVVKCTVCKAVISSKDVTGKEADPKGHKEAVRFVEATCEKNGQSETYCTVCNKVLKTEDLGELAPSKGGHKLGDWTADKTDKKWKDVTCKENGLKVEVQICSVCKEKVNRRETVVESTGTEHKYPAVGKGTVVMAATCDKNGIERVTCEFCKISTYRVVPAGHNWETRGYVEGKVPTCAKDGEEKFECTVCGKTKTEKVSKSTIKHQYETVGVVATCEHPDLIQEKCSVCGNVKSSKEVAGSKPLPHTPETKYVPATCTENGKNVTTCTVCKKVLESDDLGDLDPATGGHEYEEKVVAPNCKEKGYTLHTCKKCGDSYKTDETEPNGQHVVKLSDPKDYLKQPTCTSTGISKATCAVCKADLGYAAVPMTPHVFDGSKAKITKEPTCTEPGIMESPCANGCGAKATEELAALGHKYGEEKVSEDGKTVYQECSVCGDIKVIWSEDPCAGKHTPGEPQKEKEVAATCDKAGSYEEVVYCTVCKKEISRTPKTVDALGHKPGAAVKEKEVAATCETAGSYEEVITCTVCKKEISRTPKTVAALGHKPGAAVKENEVAATCDKAGSYEEVTYCTVCKKETSRAKKTVPAGNHTPGAAVKENEVAATCDKEGSYEEVTYCTVCKKEISRVKKTVEKTGHTFGDYEYEYNEETNRWDVYRTCTVCGTREKIDY